MEKRKKRNICEYNITVSWHHLPTREKLVTCVVPNETSFQFFFYSHNVSCSGLTNSKNDRFDFTKIFHRLSDKFGEHSQF